MAQGSEQLLYRARHLFLQNQDVEPTAPQKKWDKGMTLPGNRLFLLPLIPSL